MSMWQEMLVGLNFIFHLSEWKYIAILLEAFTWDVKNELN